MIVINIKKPTSFLSEQAHTPQSLPAMPVDVDADSSRCTFIGRTRTLKLFPFYVFAIRSILIPLLQQ